MDIKRIRVLVVLVVATTLIGWGLWTKNVAMVAMGVGALGSPSISVTIAKEQPDGKD